MKLYDYYHDPVKDVTTYVFQHSVRIDGPPNDKAQTKIEKYAEQTFVKNLDEAVAEYNKSSLAD